MKKIASNFVSVLLLSQYYLPWKGAWPTIWKKTPKTQHKSFYPRCYVPSLIEIGTIVFVKKIFKFCQGNFTNSVLSPLGKGLGCSFEQNWIPLIQGCFVPSLVESHPVALEKLLMYLCYFTIISPWKAMAVHLKKKYLWIPSIQDVPSSVEVCPVVLEKKKPVAQWAKKAQFMKAIYM